MQLHTAPDKVLFSQLNVVTRSLDMLGNYDPANVEEWQRANTNKLEALVTDVVKIFAQDLRQRPEE